MYHLFTESISVTDILQCSYRCLQLHHRFLGGCSSVVEVSASSPIRFKRQIWYDLYQSTAKTAISIFPCNISPFHNSCLNLGPYKHSLHYISMRPNAFFFAALGSVLWLIVSSSVTFRWSASSVSVWSRLEVTCQLRGSRRSSWKEPKLCPRTDWR